MKLSAYLPRILPAGLDTLADLATDLHWTWSHESDAPWRRMDPEVWEQTKNPYVVLQYLTQERLAELAGDPSFINHLKQLEAQRRKNLFQPSWYCEIYGIRKLNGIAFFSMEYGLSECLKRPGTVSPVMAGSPGRESLQPST